MRRYRTLLVVALAFIAVSAITYFIHYQIFHDVHHIFIYMVGDLAFLPLEVFIVVIVIERVLARREKQSILQKLNMVIGAFYSEVGTELLQKLGSCFITSRETQQQLEVKAGWNSRDFKQAEDFARSLTGNPDCVATKLEDLRTFLIDKRWFLLGLLENPNLLEHEMFTDLLWATFHVAEELEARPSVSNLSRTDLNHVTGDINRMYGRLAGEWVEYAHHLQTNYPFLFSLVVRTHPFQEHPSATVTE